MNTSAQQQHTTSGTQYQLRRFDWLVQAVVQLVIFLRDASTSMTGAKARKAQAALEAAVAELALPQNRGAFIVGIVDFSDSARATLKLVATDRQRNHEYELAVALFQWADQRNKVVLRILHQDRQFRKLPRIFRPTLWLFSG